MQVPCVFRWAGVQSTQVSLLHCWHLMTSTPVLPQAEQGFPQMWLDKWQYLPYFFPHVLHFAVAVFDPQPGKSHLGIGYRAVAACAIKSCLADISFLTRASLSNSMADCMRISEERDASLNAASIRGCLSNSG